MRKMKKVAVLCLTAAMTMSLLAGLSLIHISEPTRH